MAEKTPHGKNAELEASEMNDKEQIEEVDLLDRSGEDRKIEEKEVSTSPEQGGARKKNKKQKKKKKDKVDAAVPSGPAPAEDIRKTMNNLQQIQHALERIQLQSAQPAKTEEEAKRKIYQFWDTQPMPKIDEKVTDMVNKAVEPDKAEIRQEPYSLPQGFSWDILDVTKADDLHELYSLLFDNYVEDDDNMFRFDYSKDFLKWALTPTGWLANWHCAVRVTTSRKLVGFISAVPAHIRIYDHVQKMVEINFLCVHKKLRSKRMAPVLIREITRRVHMQGVFQAVYTAGIVLPKPITTCKYWHRSLNPKKLIDVKFSHLSRNMTLQRTVKLYRLPEETKLPLKPLQVRHIKECTELLNTYLQRFSLVPIFTEADFRHWFLPRENIVDSYVVEGEDGAVTDMISFYTLPSTIVNHPVHKQLKAAYSFYNISTKTPLVTLMHDALVLAKRKDFDVFNALDLMDNRQFLEELKFGVGDGNLQYYIYNWRCPGMTPDKVGLVLQ